MERVRRKKLCRDMKKAKTFALSRKTRKTKHCTSDQVCQVLEDIKSILGSTCENYVGVAEEARDTIISLKTKSEQKDDLIERYRRGDRESDADVDADRKKVMAEKDREIFLLRRQVSSAQSEAVRLRDQLRWVGEAAREAQGHINNVTKLLESALEFLD